jgi:mono/diheme cytochrome c family protein
MKRIMQQLSVVIVVMLLFVGWLNGARLAGAAIENNSAQGASEAAALYKSKCATCHGKDGRAKTFKAKFNSARNLTDASWQERVTDERIFNSIANGRGKMPAYGEKLSDAQIESLVAHVRSLKK